jgi:hypothetical protein
MPDFLEVHDRGTRSSAGTMPTPTRDMPMRAPIEWVAKTPIVTQKGIHVCVNWQSSSS